MVRAAMTPAEREALKLAAEKASHGPYTCMEFEHADYGTGEWHGDGNWFVMEGGNCENIADEMTENDAKYYAAVPPDAILHLLDLISSLELTLSNATKELEKTLELGALQVGKILQMTSVIRRYREDHSCDSGVECFHSCFGDCDICKAADALLAAPTEQPKLEASGKWISVDRELPPRDLDTFVIAKFTEQFMSTPGMYNRRPCEVVSTNYLGMNTRIYTHWQPLPAAPTEPTPVPSDHKESTK